MEEHDPTHQITTKTEASYNAISLISTQATRVHKQDLYLSRKPRNQATNTRCNAKNCKYALPASRIPIKTSLAKRNTTHCKQSFQNRNDKYLEVTKFIKPNFPPIRRHSTNISKHHCPKIASALFASNYPENQLPRPPPNNFSNFKRNLDVNHINKNKYNMPSKKSIARVRFISRRKSTTQLLKCYSRR